MIPKNAPQEATDAAVAPAVTTTTVTDDGSGSGTTETKPPTTTEEEVVEVVVHRIQKLSEMSVHLIVPNDHPNDTTPPPRLCCVPGWIYSVRVQGAGGTLIFLDLNDGSLVTPLRALAECRATATATAVPVVATTEANAATEAEAAAKEATTPKYYYYETPTATTKFAYLETTNSSTTTASITTDNNNDNSNSNDATRLIPIDTSDYQALTFEQMSSSTQGCCIGASVMVMGYVTQPPPTSTQPFELKVRHMFLMGPVPDASKYPIQKSILKKPVALRGYSHARFRAPLVQQFMKIRATALYTVHEFFFHEQVPLLDPNILTNNDCEGAGEVFTIQHSDTFFHTEPAAAAPGSTALTAKASRAPPTVQIIHNNNNNNNNNNNMDNATTTTATMQEETTTTDATVTPPTTTISTDETPINNNSATDAAPNYIGLTVSSQLPLEAMAMGTGSVYTCQKSFRAEKSDTNKHLAEFLHIEYEAYFITLHDLMNQAERFVKYVIRTVLDRCAEQYAFLNHRTTGPEEFHQHDTYLRSLLDRPFVRITHADAVTALLEDARNKVPTYNPVTKQNVKLKFKVKPAHGEDLGSEHEKYLVQKFGTFVFVTHWPSEIKSFYMKQVGDGTCESFDLLAPIVGELFGGSMREWRYEVLESVMNSKKMDVSTLQWFINLRKDGGTAPHGGWGMGFDRLVMFLTNTQSVRDIVPYPVYYGHCPY